MKLQFASYLLAIMALAIPGPLLAQDTPPADTLAIATPQQALDAALSFMGLTVGKETKPITSLAQAVQKVAIPDSTIPFSSALDTASETWEVRLELSLDDPQDFCSRLVSCVVRMDANTGKFLEARLPTRDSAASIPLQSGRYWQRHLENAMFTFHGFLNEPPPKCLFKALDAHMLSHPCLGSEIVVWCVLLSSYNGPPKPYWCIVGRNSRFVELHREKGQLSHDGMLVNYLSLIDATTGEPSMFMN